MQVRLSRSEPFPPSHPRTPAPKPIWNGVLQQINGHQVRFVTLKVTVLYIQMISSEFEKDTPAAEQLPHV